MTEQMGRVFDETLTGTIRRYWFTGGLAAGVLGVGAIQHWGMGLPNVALIVGAGALLIALQTAKQRGGWDV